MKVLKLIIPVSILLFKSVDAFVPNILEYNCTEADPIEQSTFEINHAISRLANGNWRLDYQISWEPPIQEAVMYLSDLQVEKIQNGLTPWIFSSCDEVVKFAGSHEANGNLSSNPTILQEIPFTHNGLFQVVYGVTFGGSPIPISPVTSVVFETPDCFEATEDATFCAEQDVLRCGMPINVSLEEVTSRPYNNISMAFSWSPPVQVNRLSELVEYRIQFHTEDGDLLLTDTIRHNDDEILYHWEAISPYIEEDFLYKITLVPYVSSKFFRTEPGRLFTKWFAAEFIMEATSEYPFATEDKRNMSSIPRVPSTQKPFLDTAAIVALSAGLVLLLVILIIACFLWKRRRRRVAEDRFENRHLQGLLEMRQAENRREVDPSLKHKEIKYEQVTIECKLGEGEFGVVFKGTLSGMKDQVHDITVAIKTTKVGAFSDVKEDLLNEMKLIAELGDHVNILFLLACCSITEPYYLITEHMKYGDLLGFLRKCRKLENLDEDPIYSVGENQQFIIARDVAKGMAHIQGKRFYHGDLAARNVLVGEGLTIKIADFGLADDIYTRGYKRRATEQKIPVKWCSLETILNGICSSEGDAWSFGVLMYEIFTLGATPYPGIAPRFLVSQLKNGYRMEQPENCPDDIYDLMKRCWQESPDSRPRFARMVDELGDMLMTRCDYIQFDGAEDETEIEELLELPRRSSASQNDYQISNGQTPNLAPILDEDFEVDFDELQDVLRKSQKETGKSVH
ncbi:uncharacterized protein [Apostichopus japonicus]|uniref:uncharacterized protein n=1 Tax=Stichopus japonicus TaxID=307972 RepID=UPI003AB58411